MAQLEKERDDAIMAKRINEEKLNDVTSQLNEKSDEAQQLRQILRSIEEGRALTKLDNVYLRFPDKPIQSHFRTKVSVGKTAAIA